MIEVDLLILAKFYILYLQIKIVKVSTNFIISNSNHLNLLLIQAKIFTNIMPEISQVTVSSNFATNDILSSVSLIGDADLEFQKIHITNKNPKFLVKWLAELAFFALEIHIH